MVVVTGIGLVSALGNSLETSWQRLLACQSGIHLHQPFPEQAPKPLALIGKEPASLTSLTDQAVAAAVQDAGLALPLPDCGVVIGSSRGHQASWERWTRQMPAKSAMDLGTDATGELSDWTKRLPHMPAINTARQIGAIGPVLAPMAACATGLWAIAQGSYLVETS